MTIADSTPRQLILQIPERWKGGIVILAAACLILAITLLQAHVYGERDYRQDEIYVLRLAQKYDSAGVAQSTAFDMHPPGWRLLVNAWTSAFGIQEDITRWLSKLTNLISFGILFQLGKHIGGRRVGLFAVFLLGIYGFASSAMSELRPYPMLIMLTSALHLLFFRWLREPKPRLMLAYVAAGIAVIYTHFFSVFVFPAHAVCLLLFTRFQRKHWLDSLYIWFCIGLSFLGWLLPFLQAITVVMPGGIYYAIPSTLAGLQLHYHQTKFEPEFILQFLALLSLVAPWTLRRFHAPRPSQRLPSHFLSLYPVVLLIAVLLIAFCANAVVSNFSERNVVMFAPLIALCLALGMRTLPASAALVLLLLLSLHAPRLIARQTTEGPYRAIVQSMSESYENDSLVVTEFEWAWHWLLPAAYYLNDFTPDQMSKERIYHIISPDDEAHPPNHPDKMVNLHFWFNIARFDAKLPAHKQLWHLQQGGGNDFREPVQTWLDSNYAHIRTEAWAEGYQTSHSLSEYARAPNTEAAILHLDERLRLYHWQLLDSHSVSPCQSVTVESWWQLTAPDATPYSISLILASSDGRDQLAITTAVPADEFTSDWRANKFYRDRSALEIPCDIEPSQYNLLLAAKESDTGRPLPLARPGSDPLGNEIYLTTLIVEAS